MSSSSGKDTALKTVGLIAGSVAVGFLAAKLFGKSTSSSSSASSAPVSTPKKAEAKNDKPAEAAAKKEEKVTASEPPRTPFLRSLSASPQDEKKLRPPAVIVVDPVSTGANLAHEIMTRKIPCIRVYSRYVPPSLVGMIAQGVLQDYAATIHHDEADWSKTINTINNQPYTVTAVIAGSELGTELADQLSDRLGLKSNGPETSFLRRDKYQMGEAVRRSRVRAVKQARVTHWEDIELFLKTHKPKPFKIVIKPIRSAGSDNVYLCDSEDELKSRFKQIIGHTNQLNITNGAVVVQEYLEGKEYVVDTVSRDGVHKCSAIWVYDKRAVNGAAFVYFGMRAVDTTSEIAQSLFLYQRAVLDALGIQHGPAHSEVMFTKDGPCLVECGARPHGAEGTFIPIARRVFGCDQVSMCVDAYTDEKKFLSLPDMPSVYDYGLKVDLVSFTEGKVVDLPHLETIRKLRSFISFDMLPAVGDKIFKTVDCFTAVGSISLVHKDKEVVEADHDTIRKLEPGFFTVAKD